MKLRSILTILLVLTLVLLLAGCAAQVQGTGLPENQKTWTMILALIAPLIIALVKQSGLTKQQNSVIALGLCLLVAVGDAFYFGLVDPMDIAETTFDILVGAFAAYKMIFQPFGFDDWLTNATSVIKKPG